VSTFFLLTYLADLIGAALVSAWGWTCCELLNLACRFSLPIWFAGYLCIYSADRLYLDPVDLHNVPRRILWRPVLQPIRVVLLSLSLLILVLWPVLEGQSWLGACMLLLGAPLIFYSRPIPAFGFRLKDVPLMKSILVPLAIATFLIALPILSDGRSVGRREVLVFVWCYLALAINGLAFDYRDICGDRLLGTRTLASCLGDFATKRILFLLCLIFSALTFWLAEKRITSPVMLFGVIASCLLLSRVLRPRVDPLCLSLSADLLLLMPVIVQVSAKWLG
jgi:4-hydroxybenzoate polyprenyltransferase